MAAPPPPSSQVLPTKEANLFKQVVKLYEGKQYKKAIKTADTILKKFPEHGETLSMKGLTLSYMDKKEEAYEYVRRGLKADLKSHVCWHVYGLLYRADREYREAIKCYMNALRIDKENVQILRDLALLQVQLRDLPGFVESRQQLLNLKPNNRNHWIAFAVAHHINSSHDVAVQVLEAYEATLEEVPPSEMYEHSEMLLYKASVLAEGDRAEEALALLEKSKDKIRDNLARLEMQASLLLKVNQLSQAESVYRQLLTLNPDNYKLHEGLQAATSLVAAEGGQLTDEQRWKLARLYGPLAAQHQTSLACKRIPLDFLVGDDFRDAADQYCRRALTKGVPSLFVDMRPLYKDPTKVVTIQLLMEQYNAHLRDHGSYPPFKYEQEGKAQSPQTRVWVLAYLAQHADALGDAEHALVYIDEAIAHTPTLIELHTWRCKILKHAGDLEAAAHAAETARRMDLSDRYLNTLAVKALFRAGYAEVAEKTAALFTKDADQVSSLYDMQHMQYELAAGRAHLKQRQYGKALKMFTMVNKHFDDMHEDQFDFHTYCIRKMTLRAYVGMLRMEDALFAHASYSKATCCAIRCYLDLHDRPAGSSAEEEEEAALAALSPEERKKAKLRKKKEEKKKKEEEERAAAIKAAAAKEKEAAEREAAKGKGDKKKPPPPEKKEVDPDPLGAKLAAVENPLAEAVKLVAVLKEHAAGRLTTHTAAFEVYIRKGKLLLALSAVQRAAALGGAGHPEVHTLLVRLVLKVQAMPIEQSTVREVVEEGVAQLLGQCSLQAYSTAWAAQHGSSTLAHRVATAEALVALDATGGKAPAVAIVLATPLGVQPVEHEACVAAHTLLATTLGDATAAAEWKKRCAQVFRHSLFFEGPDRLQVEQYPEFANGLAEAFGKLAF